MDKLLKKIKEMKKKSFNILENSDDEIVDSIYELDDEFEELIEMVWDIKDEQIQ